ncbi:hypothetical protein FDP41_001380 [Naegleria fowleri]|uniref:Uncharacterized protein n=1 Tax=Naegleria fowleri TaxID=5763 RepID=A0A6A5BYM7_NAEFO|nr:uncharacterized protein FDP41_001380 [Naegleria fowleri]KAF0979712.1 hypothetical protein FDP41_001380 [Naegleria fowleri]CAG4708521.1 unnamed protein product [Naegleria fowleri]
MPFTTTTEGLAPLPFPLNFLSTIQSSTLTNNNETATNHTASENSLTQEQLTTLMATKLSTLFGILIGSFLVSLVPLCFGRIPYLRKRMNHGLISIVIDQCNGFAGGVLLSVGILHLMNEGNELLHEGLKALGDEKAAEYPFAPMVMCMGFLVLYGLEFVLLAFLSNWFKTSKDSHDHGHHHHDHGHSCDSHVITIEEKALKSPTNEMMMNGNNNSQEMLEELPTLNTSASQFLEEEGKIDLSIANMNGSMDTMEGSVVSSTIPLENQPSPPSIVDIENQAKTTCEPTVCAQHHAHHDHGHNSGDHTACAHHEATQMLFETNHKHGIPLVLTAIVLWLALSTHSIFIGLGFGAENDIGNMWSIFAAIIAHQFIEAFSLGSIVEKGCRSLWMAISLLFLYSISVPVGIAIGLGIVSAAQSNALENESWKVTQGILMSIASGAFVYVSLMEIAIHQPKNKYLKLSRFCLMLLGFAAMAVLAVWA